MRWTDVIMLIACGGCQQLFGLDAPTLITDAAVDTGPDAAPTCLGSDNLLVCVPSNVPATLMLAPGATVVDTDQPCPVVDSTHPTWCIYAAQDVVISSTLRGEGARPLVIVGLASVEVTATGVIDVASYINGSSGAGADTLSPMTCNPGTAGTQGTNGGGGGAGGSFSTRGGNGGRGDGGTVPGGTAGDALGNSVVTLRGGCAGTAGGGGGFLGGTVAAGGAGGGAVYLAAGVELRVTGSINASGAGGTGGVASKGGGGGGGSGGMIALWAPSIAVSNDVFAHGGGGGGGADNGAGGIDGGESGMASEPAPGGFGGGTSGCSTGPGCGGDGAASGTTTLQVQGAPGGDDKTGAGGGGGGGGRGLIYMGSS